MTRPDTSDLDRQTGQRVVGLAVPVHLGHAAPAVGAEGEFLPHAHVEALVAARGVVVADGAGG